MSNFLYYSDYTRFIKDLEQCRELKTVTDLMNDFTDNFIDYNSSFFNVFLDAIWKLYPEYDFDCNMNALNNLNEEYFSEYENPRLEFVAQYLYYLSDEHFEKQLAKETIINSNPYDFEEEAKFLEMQESFNQKNTISENVSFGIKEKYSCNVKKIFEEVNEQVPLYSDDNFPKKMAELLTAKDIYQIQPVNKKFRLISRTNQFVYLVDELKINFHIGFEDYLFEQHCQIYTKKQASLTARNIQTTRNRNKLTLPISHSEIKDLIKKYSPESFDCWKKA